MNTTDIYTHPTPPLSQPSSLEIPESLMEPIIESIFRGYMPQIQVHEGFYRHLNQIRAFPSCYQLPGKKSEIITSKKEINKDINEIKPKNDSNKNINGNYTGELEPLKVEVNEDLLSSEPSPINTLAQHFSHISDPRVNRTKRHQLP